MKIIDFHTHIYPSKICEKAVESVGEFYGIHMDGSGSAKTLLSTPISNFVILPVAINEKHVESINDFVISECNKHEEFYGFCTTHLNYENKLEELKRCLSLGAKGVKLHPDTQKFKINDKGMYEFYDYLQEKQIPIVFHCGDYRYTYSHPKRLKKLLDDFPRLTVVAAHFGGWSLYDLALEYLKDTNCYLDTSSSFQFLGLKRAKELINIYGAERIVFGSDFPMWTPESELETFINLNLSSDDNELILYKNAQRILGIGE